MDAACDEENGGATDESVTPPIVSFAGEFAQSTICAERRGRVRLTP
jgi:hypothetical protein